MRMILRWESFEVFPSNDREQVVIDTVKKTLITYSRSKEKGKMVFKVKDQYYHHVIHTDSIIFANSELESFIFKLRVSGIKDLSIETDKYKISDCIKLPYISTMQPRDEQPMFIKNMVEKTKTLIEARTGYGKTFMACTVMNQLKCRTMVYVRPTYIAKWKKDIAKYFDVNNDDIYVIAGRESLDELIASDKKYDFIIASNVTMSEYIKSYTNAIKQFDSLPPTELLEHLGVKLLLSDESHQFFNNLYRAVIMLNPERFIGLSATLITKDAKLESLHQSLFPEDTRIGLKAYKKFTHFVFMEYTFYNMSKDAGTGGFGYNHNNFESLILREGSKRINYLNLINDNVVYYYINNRRRGDKLLIYAKSLDMIEAITVDLSKRYPDLVIRKYIGGSNYKNILESDVTISHPAIAGAAVDIPMLISVINTINLDSPSQYMQMAGRLREIENIDVTFVQLYSSNIFKHKKYILGNMKYIKTMSKTIKWEEAYNMI